MRLDFSKFKRILRNGLPGDDVKSSSRDRIVAEMEHVFRKAGADDYDSGMAHFKEILDSFLECYEPMRSKENLITLLDALPEPSWLTMRFTMGVFQYAPQLLRHGLKQMAARAEEDLPEVPRGRPGLDAFTKAQIVAKVGKWHVAGYSLDQAKKRVALHFNVSESTVQRAWDDRRNREAVDFRSVVKFLTEDAEEGVGQ
jgi:hypothetical protein